MTKAAKYLYVIGSSRDGPIKFGIANKPNNRKRYLQCGTPYPLKLYWIYPCPRGEFYERIIHRILQKHRIQGEWFDISVETAVGVIWIASNFPDNEFIANSEIDDFVCHIGLCAKIGHLTDLSHRKSDDLITIEPNRASPAAGSMPRSPSRRSRDKGTAPNRSPAAIKEPPVSSFPIHDTSDTPPSARLYAPPGECKFCDARREAARTGMRKHRKTLKGEKSLMSQ